MLKTMIAATAVLAIGGSSTIYAQQQFRGPSGTDQNPRVEQQYRPSADDIKAFSDVRIDELKAGLDSRRNMKPSGKPSVRRCAICPHGT